MQSVDWFTRLVSDNGMSAPAWVFFTTIGAGLIKLMRDTRKLKDKSDEVKEAADQTVTNTKNVSNGFANGVKSELADVKRMVIIMLDNQSEMQKDIGAVTRNLDKHIEEHKEKPV